MHNLFIDGARRAMRQQGQRVDIDDVAHELAAPPSSSDQAIDLQRCLLRLPDEQREVLLLVTLQDLAYDDVARMMGTPVGHRDVAVVPRPGAVARLDGRRAGPAAVVPLKRLK
jgi:DNA-directed RNA polymerase specialized sigma24 family protein